MKFISKCPNQVLVKKPNDVKIQNGYVFPEAGERIRFKDGVYETTDKSEIAWLKKHRLYGIAFVSEETNEQKAG